MKIDYDNRSHECKRAIKFEDLEPGDLFRQNAYNYIKTNSTSTNISFACNAICLGNGEIMYMDDDLIIDYVLVKPIQLSRDDFVQWYEDYKEKKL